MATFLLEDLNLVAPVPSTPGPKTASTRGARRRLQQRARRRRGKLERRTLGSTAGLPCTYAIGDIPFVVPEIMEVEDENVNSIVQQHFAEDAKCDLMEVPVCATMAISQLEEDESSLEVADVFIMLPTTKPLQQQRAQLQKFAVNAPVVAPTNPPTTLLAMPAAPHHRHQQQQQQQQQAQASQVEDIDHGSTGCSSLALENHIFEDHQSIPAIRTFVHFPSTSIVGARRRAQSM